MKSAELTKLNFENLLHYGGEPDDQARLYSKMNCTGYCVSCEKMGFLDSGDVRLDQMSHGADTDDFERAICKLPPGGIDTPVVFLLESPGGYYGNGRPIPYQRWNKQPPVNHYYWIPNPKLAEWPIERSNVNLKAYGPYFAYIIAAHRLQNAYFTNIVKCSLATRDADNFIGYYVGADPDIRDSKIRANCCSLFLSKELNILKPTIVFYFGNNAKKMGYFSEISSLLPDLLPDNFVTLYHPAARCSANRIITHNDKKINDALSRTLPTNVPP